MRCGLKEACVECGVTFDDKQAHAALYDTKQAALLLEKLIERAQLEKVRPENMRGKRTRDSTDVAPDSSAHLED